MTSTPTVGWCGRTFGWSGSRAQWLTILGGSGWLAGLIVIVHYAQTWSIGLSCTVTLGWFLALVIAARGSVRDLFGPVFFYDLLRVSRNRFTFILRGLFILSIGAFLALDYYGTILNRSYNSHDYSASAQLSLFGAVIFASLGIGTFRATRESWHFLFRLLVLIGAVTLSIILTVTAIVHFAEASGRQSGVSVLPSSTLSRFANEFFEKYVIMQFIVMSLLTPVYVAATIAVEKERKTLEFLLATDLQNREIVFGKLASRVLTLVMYVLAGLPLMAFLQLFGGIDPEQLLAATVATVTLVLGLSAISIWVSATLRRSRDAIVITYLLALAYGVCSFMLAGVTNFAGTGWWNTPATVCGYTLGLHDIFAFLAEGNPAWAILKIESAGRIGGVTVPNSIPVVLRDFVVFWMIAIILLLGSAILKVRRVALAQAYGGVMKHAPAHPKSQDGKTRQSFSKGTKNPILLLIDGTARRPPIGDNPLTWKEVFVDSTFRNGWTGRILAFIILALVFIWPLIFIWIILIDPINTTYANAPLSEQWHDFQEAISGWARVTTGVLGFLMMMAACVRGASSITGEMDRDTWVSLTSTPLSSDDMLWGKFWGCVFSMRRAFSVLMLVWGLALATGSMRPEMIPVMLLLTAVYISAFSLVGIYCSATARTTLIASVRAFFAGLFCAGGFWIVLGLCCLMPMGFADVGYKTIDAFNVCCAGFTPPLVYGIFPLPDFEDRSLGPFENRGQHIGMLGPLFGTVFWILFTLMMVQVCRTKLSQAMNRSPTRQKFAPGQKGPVATRIDFSE